MVGLRGQVGAHSLSGWWVGGEGAIQVVLKCRQRGAERKKVGGDSSFSTPSPSRARAHPAGRHGSFAKPSRLTTLAARWKAVSMPKPRKLCVKSGVRLRPGSGSVAETWAGSFSWGRKVTCGDVRVSLVRYTTEARMCVCV
jgi:hypothetical protein